MNITSTGSWAHAPLLQQHRSQRNRTNLGHIEVLETDDCIIPVAQHVPSAAPRCVAPLCGPLQQGQQQQCLLSSRVHKRVEKCCYRCVGYAVACSYLLYTLVILYYCYYYIKGSYKLSVHKVIQLQRLAHKKSSLRSKVTAMHHLRPSQQSVVQT